MLPNRGANLFSVATLVRPIRLKDQAMAKKSTSKNEIKKYVKDSKGGTPKIKMVEDEGAILPEQLLKRSGRGKKK